MKLKHLCDAAGISCPVWGYDREIHGIVSDSRGVREGDLFVCIRGLHSDGHMHIEEAIARGAGAVLVDRYAEFLPQEPPVFLRCADTRRAEAELHNAWNAFPATNLKLIGVTGTNGKTSVTHMIRRILTSALHPTGMIGTLGAILPDGTHISLSGGSDPNANMTTPDPAVLYSVLARMRDAGAEYVVMEVSSHALTLEKLAPLEFAVGIFTNLTPEHLDFHKTMDAYAAAKEKLFEHSDLTICNLDSPYGGRMCAHAKGRVIGCTAMRADADFCAAEVQSDKDGSVSYCLRSLRTRLHLRVPLPGEYTVINSMQAAICALECGCSPAAVKAALSTMPPVAGRMERVRLPHGADITALIDYAHTPDALEQSLGVARTLCRKGSTLTLLFGCGGDRDRTKRPIMGGIAERLSDRVIVTSDNPRTEDPNAIIREILDGMAKTEEITVIPDRATAIRHAVETAHAGDVLLLAGKGHEEYEITKEGRRPFSERDIVREAVLTRIKCQNDDHKQEDIEP